MGGEVVRLSVVPTVACGTRFGTAPFSTPPFVVPCVCSVKPQVLQEVAPLMRTLRGHSLCIHARVEDDEAGFDGNKTVQNSEQYGNSLMLNAKPIFECAEVGYMRGWALKVV